ncbi:MAG TPA: hypothetical protein DIU09_00480 [Hyphomonadaceae bacterium]|nr:hypothetical protein AEM38_11840 [Hyphomonadaceae bacterium UKL13-1]HCP63043.1 hypothetical protein [Hyphomonadaceae bacterium]
MLSPALIALSMGFGVQGHKNGLLGTDSGVSKWPIRLASNAKCSSKTGREYGHMRHIHGAQTNRLLIARTFDHSLQDKLASGCTVKPF